MSLTRKTLVFLQYVFERYDADYIVKVDDDVYLRTDRLPHILNQWKLHGAGGQPMLQHPRSCVDKASVSLHKMSPCFADLMLPFSRQVGEIHLALQV